jgi:hypothetical protein
VLAGFLVAATATLISLAAVEGAVRLLHLVPTKFWEPDPLLGTRLIPGKRGWWTQEEHEFRVPVQINGAGFRDVEHPLTTPDGVKRVLVLGDSFIESLQVPLEDAFVRRLEGELNATGARYEVIGMGISGYGTAGQFLTYRERGRAYHPDVVVVAFYAGNDVRNNSPTLEPALRPVYAADGTPERVLVIGRERVARDGFSWRDLLAQSQAYSYLRKRVITQHPAFAGWLAKAGLLAPEALNRVPMQDGVPVDFWVYATRPPAEWEGAWVRTEDVLRRFRAAVEADGARFVVALVTARELIYPDSWEQILATYPAMRNLAWNTAGPEQRMEAWCTAERMHCVALTPVFRAQRDAGPRLHYVYDGHWTAAGHALAAKTVAAALREGEQ